jgi:hypothetical protein
MEFDFQKRAMCQTDMFIIQAIHLDVEQRAQFPRIWKGVESDGYRVCITTSAQKARMGLPPPMTVRFQQVIGSACRFIKGVGNKSEVAGVQKDRPLESPRLKQMNDVSISKNLPLGSGDFFRRGGGVSFHLAGNLFAADAGLSAVAAGFDLYQWRGRDGGWGGDLSATLAASGRLGFDRTAGGGFPG